MIFLLHYSRLVWMSLVILWLRLGVAAIFVFIGRDEPVHMKVQLSTEKKNKAKSNTVSKTVGRKCFEKWWIYMCRSLVLTAGWLFMVLTPLQGGGGTSDSTAADSDGGSKDLQMSENLIYYSREEGRRQNHSSPLFHFPCLALIKPGLNTCENKDWRSQRMNEKTSQSERCVFVK